MHYGNDTSSAWVNESNTFVDSLDRNEVGGYDDHHMEAMLNDAFKYEHNNIMTEWT